MKKRRSSAEAACPCGLPSPYATCCGRYVEHWPHVPAPDPESLMRSRYSAFVHGRADYLLATWHPEFRPADLTLESDAQWLGLEVRSARWLGDAHGEVEFVARYRVAGCAVRLHERSRFVRQGGHWLYTEGDVKDRGC
ncbi:YchJ family protein [Ottowia sp.]|uniref:YchJ family protein n=1 Tax=Ottowia sp. TaxID=1898956 RepID=UPI003A87189E